MPEIGNLEHNTQECETNESGNAASDWIKDFFLLLGAKHQKNNNRGPKIRAKVKGKVAESDWLKSGGNNPYCLQTVLLQYKENRD